MLQLACLGLDRFRTTEQNLQREFVGEGGRSADAAGHPEVARDWESLREKAS